MTDRPKLTRAQRDFLQRAGAQTNGNPWPTYGMRQRAGGALNRMSQRLGRMGLMTRDGCEITAAGRAAIAKAPQ